MTQEMTEAQQKALTTVEAKLAQRANAIQKNMAVEGNMISLQKNGSFMLPGEETADELDMVVIDYRYRNQYYGGKAYRKGEYNPAVCVAIGDAQAGMTPLASSPQPQSIACDGCEMNEFGSASNGAGKACQNQLVLAVMFANPDRGDTVYLIKASPTAARPIASYLREITDEQGHPIKVITRFTGEDNGNYVKLKASMQTLNGDYLEHAQKLEHAERMLEANTGIDAAAVPEGGEQATAAQARGGKARSRD